MFFAGILIALAALVAISAIYMGGQGKTRTHLMSAVSGAVVVFCISALPFVFVLAVGGFAGTSSRYEAVFTGYSIFTVVSLVTALTCVLRLAWPRSAQRAAA